MTQVNVSTLENSASASDNKENEQPATTIEAAIEQAKRAFALRDYDESVKNYSLALELAIEKFGSKSLEIADLYLEYGKALFENAVALSAVLGKEEEGIDDEGEEDKEEKKDPRFTFEGESYDNDEDEEAVQLSELPDEGDEDEEHPEQEQGGNEEAPEDDFNAAWEVLELARVIYNDNKDEDDEIQLKLADTYLLLGDVSTETEKFDQAIEDYTTSVTLKTGVLPFSSRQIAEGHLKLALVLDITSGRLSDAIHHISQAIESVETRLSELRQGSQLGATTDKSASKSAAVQDPKGKGKARKLDRDPLVAEMSPVDVESEIKELEQLKQELQLKLEEVKTAPDDGQVATPSGSSPRKTAPELAATALDKDLSAAAVNAAAKVALSSSVNDLSAVVRKKKKSTQESVETGGATNGLKRKGSDSTEPEASEKRPRISEEPS